MQTITSRRSLRQDKKGLSSIIVVVLSLVILVVIVANVILWSYQMNQLDWERAQESLTIDGVSRKTSSFWFATHAEYQISEGGFVSGSYVDTQVMDGSYERFTESSPPRTFGINGTFLLDVSNHPLTSIKSIEIQLRFAVSDVGERWYLRAFNWTSRMFSDRGFNSSGGCQPLPSWNYYAVNLTNEWRDYVWDDGRVIVQVTDQGPDSTRTNIDIDYLAVGGIVGSTVFSFKNSGSRTAHILSIWISNATVHRRFETDLFVNSGETFSYTRLDISLPIGQYTAKAVTERGNIGVYTGD